MRFLLGIFCLSALLVRCTGTLEDITTQTREQVKSSEEEIKKTARGAMLQGAIDMLDSDDPATVGRGLQRLILELEEKSLGAYIGTPLPISEGSVSMSVDGVVAAFPNVMLVEAKRIPAVEYVSGVETDIASRKLKVLPVGYRRADIYIDAVLSLLRVLDLQTVSTKFTAEDKKTYQGRVLTMLRCATSVLGARKIKDMYDFAKGKTLLAPFRVNEVDRKEAAEKMHEIINRLEDAEHPMEDTRTEARTLFTSRVGVDF